MSTLAQRRLRNCCLTGLAAGAVVLFDRLYENSLRDPAFFDGWILFGGMVFLCALNGRKKLPGLPLLSAAAWLQAHIYVGIVCGLVFLVHTKFRLPDGVFETTLWVGFVALIASGFVGLFLSRHLPHRITGSGERIIFERLPAFRTQLAERAEERALESIDISGSSAIADLYGAQLAAFFGKPRNFWSHLLGRDAWLKHLRSQIGELKRYQDPGGQEILAELDELIGRKGNLDRQHALQLVLKIWLFLHIPLGYSVLLLSLGHVLIAYALASGAP